MHAVLLLLLAALRGTISPGAPPLVADLPAGLEGPVVVEARSLDLDVRLRVLRVEADGTTAVVAEDDNGLAGTDARAVLEATADERYRAEVTPASADWDPRGEVEIEVGLGPAATAEPAARAEADLAYWRAVEARARTSGNAAHTGRALEGLGVHAYEGGRYADALAATREAMAVAAGLWGRDDRHVATLLGSEAAMLMQLGEYEAAAVSAQRSAELLERVLGEGDERVATALNALGNARGYVGDYQGARQALEGALAIRTALYGPDDARTGVALSNLGTVWEDLGATAEARDLYERALRAFEKAHGPDHPRVATPLNNIGHLLRKSGQPADAAPYYERALAIRARQLGEDHPSYALTLQNLSVARHGAGDSDAALEGLRRALAIREARLGADHPDVAVTLVNLAGILTDVGRAAEAEPLLERALAIREARLGRDHPDVANALTVRARTRAALGRPTDALADALAAEAIGREHLRVTARWLPERVALQYAGRRVSGLDQALQIATTSPPGEAAVRALWDAVIRARALVLDEMAHRLQALHAAEAPEAVAVRERLAGASARYARLLAGSGPAPAEGVREAIAAARREHEQVERELAELSASFRRELSSVEIGLDEVVRATPEDVALVSFVRTASGYAAFVLPAGAAARTPRLLPLGDAATIDRLTTSWRAAIASTVTSDPARASARELEARRVGERLRARVWDPLGPAVAGARRVFVVPDGALHLVPLAALPAGRGYLLERGPVLHTLSAERDVPRAPEDAGARDIGLLALGGPAFDGAPAAARARRGAHRGATASCESFRRLRFEPLPAAVREVEEVAAAFGARATGSPRLLTGADADEAAFKLMAPSSAALHVATHGFVLGAGCAPGTELPLQLAGLALAGATRRASVREGEEDGVLTAEEIAALDLRGVRWAALSGCDTGTGRIEAGEGVLGLRRAFAIAGVRTLLLSLWPVDDRDARRLMRGVYQARFGRGLGAPEAVLEASLAILRERRTRGLDTSPVHWAAFTSSGDWR